MNGKTACRPKQNSTSRSVVMISSTRVAGILVAGFSVHGSTDDRTREACMLEAKGYCECGLRGSYA